MTLYKMPKPNPKFVQATFIKDGFAIENFRLFMFMSALKEEKKDYFGALLKSAGIIKKLLDKNLHLLLNDKTA